MTDATVKYRATKVRGEDWKSDQYRIRLPSIKSRLNIGEDDTLYLELKYNAEPQYIYGEQTEEEGTTAEGYYDVINKKWFTLPKRMRKPFSSPLHQVVIEFDLENSSFRVYDHSDFAFYRMPELKEQGKELEQVKPVAGAATIWELLRKGRDFVDIASRTLYGGQKFKMICFDVDHSTFPEVHSDKEIDPEHVYKLFREGELPRCEVDNLSILWSPESKDDEGRKIYQNQDVDEARLKLPEKGIFSIWWKNTLETGDAGGRTDLKYSLLGSDWETQYCIDREDTDEIIVLIPCRSQ